MRIVKSKEALFSLIGEDLTCIKFMHIQWKSFPLGPACSKLTTSLVMRSSRLPRAPCDKWVNAFPNNFRGGYGLRRMCSCFIWRSCNFFYGHSAVGSAKCMKAVRRLYVNRTILMQSSCGLRSLSTEITRVACSFRTEAVLKWCGDCAVAVPFLSVRIPKVFIFTFLCSRSD